MKQKVLNKLVGLLSGKVDSPITYAYVLGYLQEKWNRGKKVVDGRALYKYNPSLRTTYKVILRNLYTMGFLSVLRVPEVEHMVYFELNEALLR